MLDSRKAVTRDNNWYMTLLKTTLLSKDFTDDFQVIVYHAATVYMCRMYILGTQVVVFPALFLHASFKSRARRRAGQIWAGLRNTAVYHQKDFGLETLALLHHQPSRVCVMVSQGRYTDKITQRAAKFCLWGARIHIHRLKTYSSEFYHLNTLRQRHTLS